MPFSESSVAEFFYTLQVKKFFSNLAKKNCLLKRV